MRRPLLLLDVDGVIALRAPVTADGIEWTQVVSVAGDTHDVGLQPEHGPWIRTLAEHFEIVWATGWEHDAPRLLGPLLNLPTFSVLEFTPRPSFDRPLRKTPDVARLAGRRPAAWVDDDLDAAAYEWAENRQAQTLLVRPDPTIGLVAAHVAQLVDFATSLIRTHSDTTGAG